MTLRHSNNSRNDDKSLLDHERLEEIVDTIRIMRKQEIEFHDYRKDDYLASVVTSSDTVNVQCHEKMTHWCYHVSELCDYDTNTIEIAISYWVRFCMGQQQQQSVLYNRFSYQLICMACYYIAVKIHEQTALAPASIAQLSSQAHTEEEIVIAEQFILSAISWKLNPPTCCIFVQYYIEWIIVAERINQDQQRQQRSYHNDNMTVDHIESRKDTLYQLCKEQIDYTVKRYEFITIPPSIIAYCSVINSFELVYPHNVSFMKHITRCLLQHIIIPNNEKSSNSLLCIPEVKQCLYDRILYPKIAQGYDATSSFVAVGNNDDSTTQMNHSPSSAVVATEHSNDDVPLDDNDNDYDDYHSLQDHEEMLHHQDSLSIASFYDDYYYADDDPNNDDYNNLMISTPICSSRPSFHNHWNSASHHHHHVVDDDEAEEELFVMEDDYHSSSLISITNTSTTTTSSSTTTSPPITTVTNDKKRNATMDRTTENEFVSSSSSTHHNDSYSITMDNKMKKQKPNNHLDDKSTKHQKNHFTSSFTTIRRFFHGTSSSSIVK